MAETVHVEHPVHAVHVTVESNLTLKGWLKPVLNVFIVYYKSIQI
jgi:hypothetical protein